MRRKTHGCQEDSQWKRRYLILVSTMCFCDNLPCLRIVKLHNLKVIGIKKTKDQNRIVKIGHGYLCLRALNLCFDNNRFCKQITTDNTSNVNYKKLIVVGCFQGWNIRCLKVYAQLHLLIIWNRLEHKVYAQ